MVMKRFLLIAIAMVSAGGCDKPTADECRQAITNMMTLEHTDTNSRTFDIEGEVRRCKGGSRKATVACATKATTLDELNACDFRKAKSPK